MNFWPNVLGKRDGDGARRTPSHLFGGRVRTSTVVLIIAFLAVWWTYDTYRPQPPGKPQPAQVVPPQVVPPGYVPDPDYTWVPRDRVQPPATTAVRPTPTTTPPPTTTTTTPWSPPCLLPPPFCPATTTPTTPEPSNQPGPGPSPSATAPAR